MLRLRSKFDLTSRLIGAFQYNLLLLFGSGLFLGHPVCRSNHKYS